MAISPNACLAVALASDGKVRLKAMQPQAGIVGTSTDDRKRHPLLLSLSCFLTCSSIIRSYGRCIRLAICILMHKPQQQ